MHTPKTDLIYHIRHLKSSRKRKKKYVSPDSFSPAPQKTLTWYERQQHNTLAVKNNHGNEKRLKGRAGLGILHNRITFYKIEIF